MTNDELRDLLYRVGETLRYDCLQSEKTVRLIHETDAALIAIAGSEQPPDHLADAGKMIAPRRFAPGETPTIPGFYWATNKHSKKPGVVCVDVDGGDVIVWATGRDDWYDPAEDYRDFYGPLTDPR